MLIVLCVYACACVCVLCELCLQLCRSACDFMCVLLYICVVRDRALSILEIVCTTCYMISQQLTQ